MSEAQSVPVSYQAAPSTNILAIIALVASCVGFTVPGIVMGHIALYQIKRTGEAGHGLAVASLIVGYILFGLSILFIIVYVIFIVVLVGGLATTSSSEFQNFG